MRSIIKCPYYYFDKALPPEMCETIINLGKGKAQKEAGINTNNKEDHSMRKGQVAWIADDWLQQLVASYVGKANVQAGWNFRLDGREDLQFATYENGAFYDWHRDCDVEQEQYRKLSVSVQLSDPTSYMGGNLFIKNFWGTMSLPMDEGVYNQGTIVVFPSSLLHTIIPMEHGKRHSLVQWFSGPDFI